MSVFRQQPFYFNKPDIIRDSKQNFMASILIAEADTITTGDLDLTDYSIFRNAVMLNSVDTEKIFDSYADVEILAINKLAINNRVLEKLPNLRFIQIMATGYDNVDLEACKDRGIQVCNVKDYSTDSVAQHVFALILALTNKVEYHWQMAREGIWSREPKFTFYTPSIPELRGKTLGIIGMGRIGHNVAEIALAFGMEVITYTRSPEKIGTSEIRFKELADLTKSSDIISLHLPLTDDSQHMINEQFLDEMKENALLINTARGGLIDEKALYEALLNKKIKGAGLDVLTTEPPRGDHPLLTLSNCIITSHMAWATLDARKKLIEKATANIETFLNEGRVPHSLV